MRPIPLSDIQNCIAWFQSPKAHEIAEKLVAYGLKVACTHEIKTTGRYKLIPSAAKIIYKIEKTVL